ncbi:MAG TPA: hypothetical protein VMT18_09785 [Planctomycetota bacterium]|nr:hypothetical protein [Planctomycetota bacterium]
MRRLASLPALLLAACASSLPTVPTPSADEGGRRQKELDWLVAALERRHPDIHSVTPPARFEDAVETLREDLPRRNPAEAFVGLLRIVALVGDSHTRLEDWSPVEELRLPVLFGAWPDGYWVMGVQPDHGELFASRLVALEGRPVADCAERLSPLVPHENEIVLRNGVARLLGLPQVLAAVGLAPDAARVALTLRGADGLEREITLESCPRAQLVGWAALPPPGWSEPLYRSRLGESWWWTELSESRTLYFQYNRCGDDPQAPFVVLAAEILERLDRGDLERLVVDLRHNGGGDSEVLRPLLAGLGQRPEWRGERVAVLIGNATYSSAMMNALALRRDLGAVLLGEPTGQKPNSFGEVRGFRLPFSGLRVGCSTKRFRLVEGDPPSLAPDVPVPTTFDDLHHGRDPVLERALGAPADPPDLGGRTSPPDG